MGDQPGMSNRIIEDINSERAEQDRRFGGPWHDDDHTPDDWIKFIRKHATQALTATPTDYRYELVRIAALAVAAIQSVDRTADARDRRRRLQPCPKSPDGRHRYDQAFAQSVGPCAYCGLDGGGA